MVKYLNPDEQVRKRNLSAWAFIPIRCSAIAPVSLGPDHVKLMRNPRHTFAFLAYLFYISWY